MKFKSLVRIVGGTERVISSTTSIRTTAERGEKHQEETLRRGSECTVRCRLSWGFGAQGLEERLPTISKRLHVLR
jgi:hypothetical protein